MGDWFHQQKVKKLIKRYKVVQKHSDKTQLQSVRKLKPRKR